MKMHMRKGLTVAVAVLMVVAATNAWAGEGWKGEKSEEERAAHFEKMTKELGLTADQKAALTKQRESYGASTKALREKMKATRTQLKEELDKPTPDKAKINAIIAQKKELVGQQMQLKVDKVLAMKQILTPEQYAKMKTKMKEKMGKKMKGRGDKGGMEKHHGHDW